MKKKTLKEVKNLVSHYFKEAKSEDLKQLADFYFKLQGLYIEIVERQQLKGGRTIYGGWPYALIVTVYDIKDNKFIFKGSGITVGDYASHKGIENVGLDCIMNNNNFYLHKYELLKEFNINVRTIEKTYNGRYNKEPFKWCE